MKTASRILLIFGLVLKAICLFEIIDSSVELFTITHDNTPYFGMGTSLFSLLLLLLLSTSVVFEIMALSTLNKATCKADVPIWLSVLVLFGNLLAGIFMLCLSEKDFAPTAAANQTAGTRTAPNAQPENGIYQGAPTGNPSASLNSAPNDAPTGTEHPDSRNTQA